MHLSPLKSPPTKVRVPDKEQRVWNDDDEIAFQDFVDDVQNDMREDMDTDYVPPVDMASGWTRTHMSVRIQVTVSLFFNPPIHQTKMCLPI